MTLFTLCDKLFFISSAIMPTMMEINEGAVERASRLVRDVFDEVGTTLATAPYLGDGDGAEDFGGADLAFAALAGWVLQPIAGFHNGACVVPPPEVLLRQEGYARLCAELRATRAGQHAIRTYAQHRAPRDPPAVK